MDSTCRNLRRLALAVASQKPVLLEGPIGCGKTALVEFMAAVTGHTKATDILKVQLGDQTDSKVRAHGKHTLLRHIMVIVGPSIFGAYVPHLYFKGTSRRAFF